MFIIRNSLFETNSSSCHSMSISYDAKKISEFINSQRVYFQPTWDDSTQDLYSFKDLLNFLKEDAANGFVDITSYDFDNSNFMNDSYSLGSDDVERLKKYIIKNISVDLLKFTLTDEENDNYPCKFLFRVFLNVWAEQRSGIPLIMYEDLFNDNLNASFTPKNFIMEENNIIIDKKETCILGEFRY